MTRRYIVVDNAMLKIMSDSKDPEDQRLLDLYADSQVSSGWLSCAYRTLKDCQTVVDVEDESQTDNSSGQTGQTSQILGECQTDNASCQTRERSRSRGMKRNTEKNRHCLEWLY